MAINNPDVKLELTTLMAYFEAILFESNEPLSISALNRLCKNIFSEKLIGIALDKLEENYYQRNGGIILFKNCYGYRFIANPVNNRFIKKLYKAFDCRDDIEIDRENNELTKTECNCLAAIIDGRSGQEINKIFGSDYSHVILSLQEKGFLKSDEQKLATTQYLLFVFGYKELKELKLAIGYGKSYLQ